MSPTVRRGLTYEWMMCRPTRQHRTLQATRLTWEHYLLCYSHYLVPSTSPRSANPLCVWTDKGTG